MRNAIPRESVAVIAVASADAEKVKALFESVAATIINEYTTTDPETEIVCEAVDRPAGVLPSDFQRRLLGVVYGIPSGIFRMSPEIKGLVQTSNNLARVHVADGQLRIGCLTRSGVNSERDDLAHSISCLLYTSDAADE